MLSKQQLEKMNKPELVQYVLNLQDVKETLGAMDKTFSARLDCIEGTLVEFSNFKKVVSEQFSRLESELAVSKKTNELLKGELDRRTDELSGKVSSLERVAYRSAEYANYETLEMSSIPTSIPDSEVSVVALSVMNALDPDADPFDLQDVHAIHRRFVYQGEGPH